MKRSQDEIELGDLFNKSSEQTTIMDQIVNTPGLQHIIEMIFFNLDFEDIMNCQQVNKAIQRILEKPIFWLNKWRFNRGLSKKNQLVWIKALQMTKNTNLGDDVVLYIQKVIEIGHFVDVPCYIDNDVLKKATEISFEEALQQEDAGVLQILAPRALARSVNAPNLKLFEVFQLSEDHPEFLHVDVVKALAPLIENLNAPDKIGVTPIHHASYWGQLEVIQFLAPLTETPNVPDKKGITPINLATYRGQLDVIKFLAPLTATPNSPDIHGLTPIHVAASKGCLEFIRILAPLTNRLNAPDKNGKTPIDYAIKRGYHEIAQFLQSYVRN